MGLFGSIKDFIDGKPTKDEEELDVELDSPRASLEPVRNTPVQNDLALAGSGVDLKVVKPNSYKDVKEVATYLKNYNTVLLNLETADPTVSRRILDFLAGVTFTIGGTFKKIAKNTYVISAPNVNVVEAPNKINASSVSSDTLGLSGSSGETLFN